MLRKSLGLLMAVSLLSACNSDNLEFVDGSKGSLTDYEGKWLYVNYYADWCKPCIKELPELDHFQKKNSEKVQLISISYDDLKGPALKQSWQKYGVSFPFASIDSDDFPLPRPKVLPTTYILDPQGKLARTLIGEQTLQSLETELTVLAQH